MSLTLSRAERFTDARTKYNKHGNQTMRDVASATGVSASVIVSLEKDSDERAVGYDKVLSLATHYGVSIDWLLGLSEDPKVKHTVMKELGLSPDAISALKHIAEYDDCISGIETLLHSEGFTFVCSAIGELKDGLSKFSNRTLSSDQNGTHESDYVKLADSDMKAAVAITKQIEQAHPEWLGAVDLNIGIEALGSLKRLIVDIFETTIREETGYDFYWKKSIGRWSPKDNAVQATASKDT